MTQPVSTHELQRLLDTQMHHRTYVMVLLASFAGLHPREIAKLRGEDVDADLRIVHVEGVALPLHTQLAKVAESMPESGLWFPSTSGRVVSVLIAEAMRRAGVPGTSRSLRFWFGTTLLTQEH